MTVSPASVKIKTPAKINLLLHIKGKRSDGYHEIVTVMQAVDLFDELLIEKADNLEIICNSPDVPSDEKNLIYKAAVKLREFTGTNKGARINLKKNIPVAAGLGGGSSDAAAAISGLNLLWELGLPEETLRDLGSEIGSDVPFFIGGPTAAGFGRGDELVQLSNETDYWYLLINPGILISTAWVYSQVDVSADNVRCNRQPLDSENWIGPLVKVMPQITVENCHPELVSGSQTMRSRNKFGMTGHRRSPNGYQVPPNLKLTNEDVHIKIFLPDSFRLDGNKIWLFPYNDLEGVVIRRYPVIKKIKDEMVASGAMCALMSGSGSSVFGIFRDRDSVERAGRTLQHYEWRTWIVKALHSSPYHIVS